MVRRKTLKELEAELLAERARREETEARLAEARARLPVRLTTQLVTRVSDEAGEWVREAAKANHVKPSELIRQLIDFGAGKNVGHRGGRYLWQLPSPSELIVCWRQAGSPRSMESALLHGFRDRYGALPFANIVL